MQLFAPVFGCLMYACHGRSNAHDREFGDQAKTQVDEPFDSSALQAFSKLLVDVNLAAAWQVSFSSLGASTALKKSDHRFAAPRLSSTFGGYGGQNRGGPLDAFRQRLGGGTQNPRQDEWGDNSGYGRDRERTSFGRDDWRVPEDDYWEDDWRDDRGRERDSFGRDGGNDRGRRGDSFGRDGGYDRGRESSSFGRNGGYDRGRESNSFGRDGGHDRGRESSSFGRDGGYDRGRESNSFGRDGGYDRGRESNSFGRDDGYGRGRDSSSFGRDSGHDRGRERNSYARDSVHHGSSNLQVLLSPEADALVQKYATPDLRESIGRELRAAASRDADFGEEEVELFREILDNAQEEALPEPWRGIEVTFKQIRRWKLKGGPEPRLDYDDFAEKLNRMYNYYQSPRDWFIPQRYGTFYDWFLRELTDEVWDRCLAKADLVSVCAPCQAVVRHHVPEGLMTLKISVIAVEALHRIIGGCQLVQFALRKVDYHRIHCPVDGYIENIKVYDKDELFPGAETLTMITFDTDFGEVKLVAIGEYTVQSFKLDKQVKVGARLRKMDELGYFDFGSQIMLVLPKMIPLLGGGTKVFPGDAVAALNAEEMAALQARAPDKQIVQDPRSALESASAAGIMRGGRPRR